MEGAQEDQGETKSEAGQVIVANRGRQAARLIGLATRISALFMLDDDR